MNKDRLVNFRLSDDFIGLLDKHCSSTGLTRTKVLKVALKHLRDHELKQVDIDEFKFVKPSTGA